MVADKNHIKIMSDIFIIIIFYCYYRDINKGYKMFEWLVTLSAWRDNLSCA